MHNTIFERQSENFICPWDMNTCSFGMARLRNLRACTVYNTVYWLTIGSLRRIMEVPEVFEDELVPCLQIHHGDHSQLNWLANLPCWDSITQVDGPQKWMKKSETRQMIQLSIKPKPALSRNNKRMVQNCTVYCFILVDTLQGRNTWIGSKCVGPDALSPWLVPVMLPWMGFVAGETSTTHRVLGGWAPNFHAVLVQTAPRRWRSRLNCQSSRRSNAFRNFRPCWSRRWNWAFKASLLSSSLVFKHRVIKSPWPLRISTCCI